MKIKITILESCKTCNGIGTYDGDSPLLCPDNNNICKDCGGTGVPIYIAEKYNLDLCFHPSPMPCQSKGVPGLPWL